MTITKDLIVLVPDKNIEFSLKGILARHQALRIRRLQVDIRVHPHRDPGCLLNGASFLSSFPNPYQRALVIFDRDGCGQEQKSCDELATQVEQQLSASGWSQRAVAIVLDPEIEIWVWSNSPHVSTALGWDGRTPDLRSWLNVQGFLASGQIKPQRPKEAMEQALRIVKKPRSSNIYLQLAEKVSFDGCLDPSFVKLCSTLTDWFTDQQFQTPPT
jgi:hypothetical protein